MALLHHRARLRAGARQPYDANGNLLTQEIPTAGDPGGDPGHTPVNYYYDGWNRLVAVKYSLPGQPGGRPRVEFEYNGLNWRTVKRSDTEASSPILNQHRIMYYSADWQLLEEHIDDSFDDQAGFVDDRHMQYVWGLRYIDDIALRQQDSDANGTFDTGWYHCTDTLFSTVAVLDEAANLVERVSYDAYGMARHHHAADIDGDGAVTQDDYDLVTANLGNFGVGDINRSGTADSRDQAHANDSKPALPRGEISKTDNIVGYAGYLFNAEIHGAGMYTVRHRHYAPDLGRWLTRDPAGYVDGMNLYEYGASQPLIMIDPAGLASIPLGACDPVRERLDEGREYRLREKQECCNDKKFFPSIECCEDGKIVPKVSVWYCTRTLDPRTEWNQDGVNIDIGPIHHAFILCKPPVDDEIPRDKNDTTYDEDGFYGFGKQPRQLFEAWDCENNRPVEIDPPLDMKKPWSEGPGYVDWEIQPVDASRCKERRICPKEKDRMCKRGPTSTPYDFLTTNCKRWAQCLDE